MTWLQWAPSLVPAETRAGALRGAVTAAPPFACHSSSGLCLSSGPRFPPSIPGLQSSSGLSPHAAISLLPGLALQTADPSTQTLCAAADAPLGLGPLAATRALRADLAPLSAPGQVLCPFPVPETPAGLSCSPYCEGTPPDVKILSLLPASFQK